jgi:hypothetical protein
MIEEKESENIKIASERGLNKSIILFSRSKTEFPGKWTNNKTGKVCNITNSWGARSFMAMDILGHAYLLKEGGGHFPNEYLTIFDNTTEVENREKEIKEMKDEKIKFSRFYIDIDAKTFRNLSGKKYMTSKEIFELLKQTSMTSFIISYPIRLIKPKGKHKKTIKEEWITFNWPTRPFEMAWGNEEIPSKYRVFFNTVLGESFIHNLLTKGYDFIDQRIYELSPSAQNFYRFFIIFHKNLPTIELKLGTIVNSMNFTNQDKSGLIHTTIEGNCLEPLKSMGIISSYKRVKTITNEDKFIINIERD